MVPFEAFSTDAAQSWKALCSGCEGGSQWASFSCTGVSCAPAGAAPTAAAARHRRAHDARTIILMTGSPPQRPRSRRAAISVAATVLLDPAADQCADREGFARHGMLLIIETQPATLVKRHSWRQNRSRADRSMIRTRVERATPK